jgi:HEAT repeat protein
MAVACSHPDPIVRAAAASVLGRTRTAPTPELAALLLDDPDALVRHGRYRRSVCGVSFARAAALDLRRRVHGRSTNRGVSMAIERLLCRIRPSNVVPTSGHQHP